MKEYNLKLVKEGRISSILIPFNAKEVFNKKKGTIFVWGTMNSIPYRSRLISKGNNTQIMIVNREMQKKLGFTEGEMNIIGTIEEDNNEAEYSEPNSIIRESNYNILECIVTRRSIRRYTSKSISEEQIITILNAGFCAPSAKAKRPWHFIVIKKRERLIELSKIKSNISMLKGAYCCIVVCGDKVRQGINDLLIADCSAATQNMLLAAHGLGLGGVWCGVAKNSDLYKYLNNNLELPETIQPISLISLGHSDQEKPANSRYETIKVHNEIWRSE